MPEHTFRKQRLHYRRIIRRVAIGRCSDMAIALIKAMAAALPKTKKDFLEMDNKALYKAISDLTYTPDEVR
jgi:hypothetical protein